MANAQVEKLKALGIRHGEKAVVALTAAVFVAFTIMAVLRETLPMQPEQLSTLANSAAGNLSKQQPPADVLAKVEKDGLIEPNLVAVVDNQLKNALKPDTYKTRLEWVTPEPGAGLIRDKVELIAPTDLLAFPGRGGILMYTLDEKGDRIVDTGEDPKKKGKAKKAGNAEKPEDKRRREDEEAKRKAKFAGKVEDPAKEKGKDDAPADAADAGPWKEETKGQRWVVLTGVIDNEQLKKNYLLALKNPAIAYPNYKRLDVERRNQLAEGGWTPWGPADQKKNYAVLDNLPEVDAELVPEAKRPMALVDPLPHLRAGYWTGVHVAKLVSAEVLQGPKEPAGGAGGPMGGIMSGGESRQPPGGGAAPGGRPGGNMTSGMANKGGSSSGAGLAGETGGNSGAGVAGGGGGDSAEANFPKIDEQSVMYRSLDFTVEPDTTYQFRARIVVVNPNLNHTDVNPGVDVESTELIGPWSEPSDPVTVLADVAAYAQAPEQAIRRGDLINFQVIKWDSKTGQTVVKNDGAGPGELIGEYGTIQMPSSEGGGPKGEYIDFNSRAIVLDTVGGSQRLPDIGLDRNQFIIPAIAMIIEPDGSVVVRDQAADKADNVREDMESNYKQAIADSSEKREVSSSSRMPSSGGDPRMSGNKKKKGKR